MDDDDEPIDSLQILTDCNIDILSSKCKPLNISLNRLDLDKNGIILVKDCNIYDRKPEPSPEREILADIKTGKQESYSNDTAETIKKIKEFIAMGRCEDSKKEPETPEKVGRYKPGPLSKKKEFALKDNQNIKITRFNMGLELERTLKGQDDSSEVKEAKEDCKDASLHKDSNFESKVSDVFMKNSEFITPSRVSKRIQNKSVKFSVKKMLRGDDANVLKRMIPGYDDETPSKKERSAVLKSVKQEVKKIQHKKSLSPSNDIPVEVEQPPEEENPVSGIKETEEPPKLSMECNVSTPEPHENDPDSASSTPTPPVSSFSSPVSSEYKASALAEKIGKFAAVTSGKITLELKGTTQKKVVRIAIPPSKSSSPLPKTSLGPDIIIKRVRPVKKTVVIPENVKPTPKTVIEKEIENFKSPVSNFPRVIKMSGGVNVERIPAPKSKDEVHQIHKTILRRGRPPKKLDHIREIRKSLKVDVTPSKESPPAVSPHETGTESVDLTGTVINDKPVRDTIDDRKKEDSPENAPSLTRQIAEALESTVSQLRTESDSLLAEEDRRKAPDKLKGRKAHKLHSLSHIKSKVESLAKKISKARTPDIVPEKSPPSSDIEESEEKDFDNLFDKYFKTEERFIEHHDSLDSDSSEDLENDVYSHFINLRKHNGIKRDIEKRDDISMFELMRNISVELPSWNIHVSSNGEIFYLAQIDLMEEKPIMKKVIEIDLQYNVKVSVNGSSVPEYEGNYYTYEDIKKLVYDVDQM